MANVQWTQAQVDSVVSAVNNRAKIASPTFTGTVGGITKAMVGLGNVDNTSDASKPVSTATQTALNLKANLASPTFTGTVTATTFSGTLSGNASTASSASSCSGNAATATSLAGGSLGTIPYQSASGTTAQLAAGTSGYYLKSNGAAAPSWSAVAAGGLPSNSQTFTSSGTFTVPAGVTKIMVIPSYPGGGGGFGAANTVLANAGGGGGGGASSWGAAFVVEVTPGSVHSIVLGAGGTGGVSEYSAIYPTNGGYSQFGNYKINGCGQAGAQGGGGNNSLGSTGGGSVAIGYYGFGTGNTVNQQTLKQSQALYSIQEFVFSAQFNVVYYSNGSDSLPSPTGFCFTVAQGGRGSTNGGTGGAGGTSDCNNGSNGGTRPGTSFAGYQGVTVYRGGAGGAGGSAKMKILW